MAVTDQYVWIGSSQGLFRIDRKTKRHQPDAVETTFANRFIYDLLVDQNRLWIASENGLFIYSTDSKILINYRDFGQVNPDSLPVSFTDFTSLEKSDSIIYAASAGGIFSFNLRSWRWLEAVDPAIFGGKIVRAMVVKGSDLFISAEGILLRYDLKRQIVKNYNYPFIGEINDMYISRGRIWLGTTEGLISFTWKRD